jgi:hypothetical protein
MRVTFAGACNRPEFFPWHLASLEAACLQVPEHIERGEAIPFECVYVGEAPFPDELRGRWPFLRYYRAPREIPPAACAAWALTQGTGDLLYHAIDDYEWEHGAIAALVGVFDEWCDDRLMPSPRYFVEEGGSEQNWTENLRLIPGRADLPYLPLDGLISRRFYNDLGGIDRRFHSVMQMVDVFARAVVAGGRTWFTSAAVHERRTRYPAGYQSICARTYQADRPLLESFWFTDGTYEAGAPRVCPVEPYTPAQLADVGAQLVEASA